MFIANKYYTIYQRLMKSRQGMPRSKKEGYYEKHHIIPKSLGGPDISSNLVLLTAREHYLAHHLLTKCTTGDAKFKMICGFYRITNQENGRQQRKFSSRQYEIARKSHAEAKSKEYTGKPISQRVISDVGMEALRKNGKLRAEENKKMPKEWNEAKNKKISDTMKGRTPNEKSTANLNRNGFSSESRNMADATRRTRFGKKVESPDMICFCCIEWAAEYYDVTAAAIKYRIKHIEGWRFI